MNVVKFGGVLVLGALVVLSAGVARADMIPNVVEGVTATAFHRGDSDDPGNGSLSRSVDGHGLTVGDPTDPSTWTHNNSWPDNWQGAGSFTDGQTPGAWFVADLGYAYECLDELYIWNVRERLDRGMKDVDIYYAVDPTVIPATGAAYDFSSGGWTLLDTYTIPQATGADTDTDIVIGLSSIPAAQYIGFDIETNWLSTFRVGVAEMQFTVPEPTTVGLLALGGVALLRRRRQGR